MQTSILVMLVGLLLVNWVEGITEALLRSPGIISHVSGYVTLSAMMGVALYLIISTFIGLAPTTQ